MKFKPGIAIAFLSGSAVATAALIGVFANQARAADKEPAVEPEIVTVYVNDGGGESAARAANKLHEKYAAAGYQFVDMEAHRENSDSKGLWVTYVKKH
jgi:hypothetical protein